MVPSKISEMTLRYEGGFLLRLGLFAVLDDALPGQGDVVALKDDVIDAIDGLLEPRPLVKEE